MRNSTAEYLSFFRPSVAAAFVFRVLSVLRPWRWLTPRHSNFSRDWFQVLVLTILFPWNLLRWKKRAREIAQEYTNIELAQSLANTRGKMTIATYGYRFIVAPILHEMGVSHSRLVACSLLGAYQERLTGKVELLGLDSRVKGSGQLIAVTDSETDAPLLERCDHSFLIKWPDALSRAPFLEVHLPFLYLTKIKWPEKNYLMRNIVGDDLPLFLLAFGFAANDPFWTALVLIFLVCSFWSLYERGYHENDVVGERREDEPKLSEAYFERICHVPEAGAWAWSLGLSFLGVWIYEGHQSVFLGAQTFIEVGRSLAIWSSVLLGCRLVFLIYNHSKKSIRPALYPFLQLFRYVSFVALVPLSFVGGLALISQVLARSLNYFLYRQNGGKEWPDVPEQIIRLGIFTFLFFGLLPNFRDELMSPVTVLIFLWFIFRASKQILRFIVAMLSAQKGVSKSRKRGSGTL